MIILCCFKNDATMVIENKRSSIIYSGFEKDFGGFIRKDSIMDTSHFQIIVPSSRSKPAQISRK